MLTLRNRFTAAAAAAALGAVAFTTCIPSVAASFMSPELLRTATKERFLQLMKEHLPNVRADQLGATDQEPQQLHLAITTNPTSMGITWITGIPVTDATAIWWPGQDTPQPEPSNASSSSAGIATYTAGDGGWSGSIYTTNMTSLIPGTWYTYTVGSPSATGGPLWSAPRAFKCPAVASATSNVKLAITADQGTIVPLGYAVAQALMEEHLETNSPFDAVLISGDISYATLDPPNNEIEWTWDSYGVMVEPYASTAPFITTAGNHEATPGNITNSSGTFENVWGAAFSARYNMPTNGNQNLWFSLNIGPVHITSLSSEHNYTIGSPQWLWLQADLAAIDRSITPWSFVSIHRPVYSSDSDEYTSHCPGAPLPTALEPLFIQYKVDLVLQGHEHCAERTEAHINGTVITAAVNQGTGTAANTYVNPGAPIYIVQGSSGAMQEEKWIDPQPEWSAFRVEDVYGYGIMHVTGANLLEYQFVDTQRQVWDAWRIVRQ